MYFVFIRCMYDLGFAVMVFIGFCMCLYDLGIYLLNYVAKIEAVKWS